MSLETEEITVPLTGHIWRGVVGTAFPTNISTAVNETLWTELGYTTEAGPRFKFGRETKAIKGWQSRDVLRMLVTSKPKSIAFDLLQLNQNTFNTAMGGGTWTEPTAGNYKYVPPLDEYVDEFALIVEFSDGADDVRFCYRKVFNQTPAEFTLKADDAITLPVDCMVLQADGDLPAWELYTNIDDLGLFTQAGS